MFRRLLSEIPLPVPTYQHTKSTTNSSNPQPPNCIHVYVYVRKPFISISPHILYAMSGHKSPLNLLIPCSQVKSLVLNEGVVSSSQLLNATCEMERKFTAAAAQSFLKTLTREHWLTEVHYVSNSLV